MTEIRETLRFTSPDLEEMNRVMGRLQDRLDNLEGMRGTPAFYADVDLRNKDLQNVGNIVQQQTTTDTAIISSGTITTANIESATFVNPINIPIIKVDYPDFPTTSDLPNSGDLAIWKRIWGLLTTIFLVVNVEGNIYYIALTAAP